MATFVSGATIRSERRHGHGLDELRGAGARSRAHRPVRARRFDRNHRVRQLWRRSSRARRSDRNGVMATVWMSYEVPAPGLGPTDLFVLVGSTGIIECDNYGDVRLGRDDQIGTASWPRSG